MSSKTRFSLAALLLAGSFGTPILAQTPPGDAGKTPQRTTKAPVVDDGLDEEIVVNGQKPPGSVVGDIPAEQTLNPADVRAYGVDSISDLLDQLSPQTTSVRGRGGEQPVVLLNGRRISSFSEIRDLPTEAILRVEILPEEVALKYGYSADQKVVNFILRQRFRSKSVTAEGGGTTDGGGLSGNASAGLVRILRDNRFNLNLRVQESDQIRESDRGLSILDDDGVNASPYRSLRPRTRTATLNSVYARPLSSIFTGTINALITATDSNALQGLPTADLLVPAGSPFGNAASLTTIGRTLALNPLSQYTYSFSEHLGTSVNGQLKAWRLSFTGNYDRADSHTRSDTGIDTAGLQARVTADDPTVNPNGNLTPYLGALRTNRASSTSNTGNVQMVANGKIAQLPAGQVSMTIKVGGTFTGFDSQSERLNIVQNTQLSRNAGNGQINVDLPITKRGTFGAIGNLTANGNIAINQLSDFGTLRTYGYGLNWTPRAPLSLIASFTDDQAAPTVQQLGNPVLLTSQARVFDYLRGTTVDVTSISGGNPNLRSDDRRVYKLGATWKPLPKQDLTFNINYVSSRIRDAIATLPEPTADIEAAFPDRFVRDAAGDLISVDTRATNFSSERLQTLRWGFNLSIPLKPTQASINAFRKVMQERMRQRAQGTNAALPPPPDGAPPPGGPPPGAPPPDGGPGGGPGGPGGPGGGGPGGFGPPGGGPGGPGGGFGGGGFRGGAGAAQRFRQNAGGRLQLTVYHTWTLLDQLLIRPGVPLIDLLHGGSIGATGGQPQHQIDAQLGYSNGGIGARLSETWKSGTEVDAATGASTGNLHFSSLATTDLRLFVNVGELPKFIGKDWARNLRVSFAVTNLFDQRQKVRDNFGVTPIRYLGPYLDPAGRGVMISFRKLFSPQFRPPPRPPQS